MTRANPIVAVCQGHRCAALLGLRDPDGMSAMRELAGQSGYGVLLSTPCAGACSHGPVVALGAGQDVGGRLQITLRTLLGPVGTEHVASLGAYLAGSGSGRLAAPLTEILVPPE